MLIKTGTDISSYLEDTSNIKGLASALYIPKDEAELILCLKGLIADKISFTVSGARTGTTAGCVPFEGVIISLENFSKVNINKDKKVIEAEASVTLETIQNLANKNKLALLSSPTESLASIAGAVNTCASGVRGFGYGSIREFINSIRVALTTGEVLVIKRGRIKAKGKSFDFKLSGRRFKFDIPSYRMPSVKSQAGYFAKDNMDLIDLFIGSEGTLGVMISCEIDLQVLPPFIFDGLAFFKDESNAFDFVRKIKEAKSKNIMRPAALEFFDRNSLKMLEKSYSFVPSAEAAVYFEQEAKTKKEADSYLEHWHDLLVESKAMLSESILADTVAEREKIFSFRHALPQAINEFLRTNKQIKVSSDIAVPGEYFTKMYEFYQKSAKKAGIHYVNFGHIGESHLHFNFLPQNSLEFEKAKEYMFLFCERAVSFGGTVSAEHGIGKIKKPYLKLMYSDKEIKEMAVVKKYFDPHCLLGLDNIFDKDMLIYADR
jgi:D-lactate dehydrogenase (cytochrome)